MISNTDRDRACISTSGPDQWSVSSASSGSRGGAPTWTAPDPCSRSCASPGTGCRPER